MSVKLTSYHRMSPAEHEKWVSNGYVAEEVGLSVRWSEVYTHYHYKKEVNGFEKAGRIAGGVIAAIGTLGIWPSNSDSLVEETFDYPLNGYYDRLVYNKEWTQKV